MTQVKLKICFYAPLTLQGSHVRLLLTFVRYFLFIVVMSRWLLGPPLVCGVVRRGEADEGRGAGGCG